MIEHETVHGRPKVIILLSSFSTCCNVIQAYYNKSVRMYYSHIKHERIVVTHVRHVTAAAAPHVSKRLPPPTGYAKGL